MRLLKKMQADLANAKQGIENLLEVRLELEATIDEYECVIASMQRTIDDLRAKIVLGEDNE